MDVSMYCSRGNFSHLVKPFTSANVISLTQRAIQPLSFPNLTGRSKLIKIKTSSRFVSPDIKAEEFSSIPGGTASISSTGVCIQQEVDTSPAKQSTIFHKIKVALYEVEGINLCFFSASGIRVPGNTMLSIIRRNVVLLRYSDSFRHSIQYLLTSPNVLSYWRAVKHTAH
ncbi:hypothetical protein H112_05837 [Trichophyton rubrum D6]|uniref:Uncharacterized protein n=3 Tax=Trichophyton TaxID=5550 RepID=A0A080WKD8_TRIRC|nr:uncharacterized protein TERG_12012 [Trichophyton rubrum CBS 118892]XP_047605973.1 uncharacterized protein TERG_12012 [Trichophyton rubrum CBS 118892]EZF15995.1 hypothetical protein H100_05851 [Trichophyton rubrum MR850]EZF40124.1 hypothetical protein H102_05820 [Trichophyton rubrum CBS 100081]EZF50749.1 hypothetical protein H103_05848 [Trichophyton rubrum CBS 288.86]EZF61354.1 hypothetical protein H104_05834 [Trichophyton rubrum CBS 289.86]EZF72007.1 hypothetical protein H105_05861 [Tricho